MAKKDTEIVKSEDPVVKTEDDNKKLMTEEEYDKIQKGKMKGIAKKVLTVIGALASVFFELFLIDITFYLAFLTNGEFWTNLGIWEVQWFMEVGNFSGMITRILLGVVFILEIAFAIFILYLSIDDTKILKKFYIYKGMKKLEDKEAAKKEANAKEHEALFPEEDKKLSWKDRKELKKAEKQAKKDQKAAEVSNLDSASLDAMLSGIMPISTNADGSVKPLFSDAEKTQTTEAPKSETISLNETKK